MGRSLLLDMIRIFAVAGVFWVHIFQKQGMRLGHFFGIKGFYYVSIGGVSVTILIILSGLVLGLRYVNVKKNYWSFIKKRCLRLYPSYYLIFMVGVVLFMIRDFYDWPNSDSLTWMDLPLSLTATYAFVGDWGGQIVPTSWFLGLIVILYALFPFLESSIRQRPTSILIFLLVSIISRLILGRFEILPGRPLDWFPLCRLFEFTFGIYLARVVPSAVWSCLNREDDILSRFINYVSALTFPLYLCHSPILNTVWHISISGAMKVGLSLIASMVISVIVLEIDMRIVSPYFRRFTTPQSARASAEP